MSGLLALSIRAQILLMALIVVLPAAGIITFSGLKLRQVAIAGAIQETRKISDGIANTQQSVSDSAEQLMTALAQLPDIRNHRARKTRKILSEILKLNPQYLNLAAVDPSGVVWASAVTTKPVSVADRRYFRNAMATGRLSSGGYVVSRITTKPTLNLCYPFKNGSGAPVGAIIVAFNLDQLAHSLPTPQPEPYSYTLLDFNGTVIGKSIEPDAYLGTPYPPELFQRIQGPFNEGLFTASGLDGQQRLITYRKLRLKGETTPYLYIRASVPIDTVVAQANAMLWRNLLVFISSLACAVWVAWLIGKHSIIDRVALLQAASRRLAGGDLKVRVSSSLRGGDLGQLGTTFDEMAGQLETRERERDCAELALRQSESRYRSLFENTLFGIVAHGLDRKFVRVNDAYCRLLGYREEELVGVRSFADLTHPEDLALSLEKHQAMVRGEVRRYTLEKRYLTKTGEVIQVVCFVEGIYDEKGCCEGNIACILDITELKENQERTRLYFERQVVGMAITSPDKKWQLTNARLQQMLGYSGEELSRTSWEDLSHPDDIEKCRAQFDKMLRGEIDEYVIENRYFRKDGALLYFIVSSGCVRKHDGKVDYVLALYNDITERTKAEQEIQLLQSSLEERVQERTAQLEMAMSEQESFSYSVSHDLRSPLRHINSYLGILEEEFAHLLPFEAHHYLCRTRAASVKMGNLIDDLLELARVSRSRLVKEAIDLSALAQGVVTALQESDPGRLVQVRITPGLTALGDKILMGQVLENLLGNAWKYSSRKKCTELFFGVETVDKTRAYFVRDNGAGFDMAYRDKLFGAFQRLHGEEYEGTGIGLATVKRIVERHGGQVWAEGQPERGASFYFTLPSW
jgi:two-component system, cell cycle sensor histidine kinase and response regulator CckA